MALHGLKRFKKHLHTMSIKEFIIIGLDFMVRGWLLAKFFPVLLSLHWAWYVAFVFLVEVYFWVQWNK